MNDVSVCKSNSGTFRAERVAFVVFFVVTKLRMYALSELTVAVRTDSLAGFVHIYGECSTLATVEGGHVMF